MKIFLIFLISFNSYAFNIESVGINPVLQFEEDLIRNFKKAPEPGEGVIFNDNLKQIFDDYQGRIDEEFKITPYFEDRIKFWMAIYTQYTSREILIHDKKNLSLIYNAISFEDVHAKDINRYMKARIQSTRSLKEAKHIKQALYKLSIDNKKLSKAEQGILSLLKENKVTIPKGTKNRRRFFRGLMNNVRVQTGQRDKIYQAIINSIPFEAFIKDNLKAFGLPVELFAKPFLESSFNTKAVSKVGAVGIWQFMKRVARSFMRMNQNVDSRRNPLISSLGAMHLMKQNRMILKRWDLAITAYNSGTKHLIKARRKLKKKAPTLAEVFSTYKSRHHGFASKNFYSSFIALVYSLAYKDILFPVQGILKEKHLSPRINAKNLKAYVSKCSIIPNHIFKALKKSSPDLNLLNKHLLNPNKTYPKGTTFFSDIKLTSRRYFELNTKHFKKYYPKNFYKLVKNQNCSSK